MFIRIIHGQEQREFLINVNYISKIEVLYGTSGGWELDAPNGAKDPNAIRHYKIYHLGDTYTLKSAPDDPVVKVIEDIYKSAVKGKDIVGGPRAIEHHRSFRRWKMASTSRSTQLRRGEAASRFSPRKMPSQSAFRRINKRSMLTYPLMVSQFGSFRTWAMRLDP